MDETRIEKEMYEFAKDKLKYTFNDISWLAKAMRSKKIEIKGEGKNHSEYTNESLATVGDALLKFIISDNLYRNNKGNLTKESITKNRESIEKNSTMHKLMIEEAWIKYSYNDSSFTKDNPPNNEKVVCKNHDPYIEAIVGAIYYDSNFECVKKWVENTLIPLLKSYAENKINLK